MGIKAKARLTINVLQDGRSSYTHVRYSADGGQTFTAAAPEALEAAKKVGGAGVNLANTMQVPKGYALPWKPNRCKLVDLLSPSELPEGAFRGVKVEQPAKWLGIYHYNQRPIQAGRYVMTLWARSDEPNAQLAVGMEQVAVNTVDLSAEWQKYSVLIHVKEDRDKYVLCLYGKSSGIFYYADVKLEEGEVPTPWTPCALDAAVGTTPARWRGELISDHPVGSLDPKVYTWVDTKGEQGETGVGVKEVVAEFATGSETEPKSDWTTTLPAWVKGQYLWKRERITYTDGRVKYTPPQRDDTWAKIGELSDQANSATRAAAGANEKADKAYAAAVDDGKVTAAEQHAIIKARVEALKAITYAEQARIKEQYAKVRLYLSTASAVQNTLSNLLITYNGKVDELLEACNKFLLGTVFTDDTYVSKLRGPLSAYYDARKDINAALYESGSFEVGGRNLFGFHKGVQIEVLSDCFTAEFAPEIRGVRIRCIKMENYKVSGGVRLRNLGFQRPGYYTASFRVKMRGGASGNLLFDICDEGYTLFPVLNRDSSVQLTAKGNHYATPQFYNGFFDFGVAPDATMNTDCVIELHNLMIERGTIPSPWCKAEEDVEWELANTEYLRTVFDQKGGIEGGLLFGSMLQMRDAKGEVSAYLNGLRAQAGDDPTARRFNRPALALGVRNFAQSGETESIAFNFDGSGHLKNLYFNGQEEGFYMGPNPETSLVKFSTMPMPTIAQLVANRTSSTSMNAETIVVEENPQHTYPKMARSVGRLEVRSVNGKLQGRVSLRVTGQASSSQNARPDVVVMAYLVSEDGTHRVSINISGHYNVDGRTFEADLYGSTLPLGRYYIEVIAYPSDVQSYRVEYKMLTDWRYVAIADRGVYGIYRNGILAFENENRYAMFKDGQLVLKGAPDAPGVLVAGTARGDNGLPVNYWGSKGVMSGAQTGKLGNGIYRIYHKIGHINYSVMITPYQKDPLINPSASILNKYPDCVDFVIREAHTFRQASTDYDFVILGLN